MSADQIATMRAEVEKEIVEAQEALAVARTELEAATSDQESAQASQNELSSKLRPLISRLETRRETLAPFIAKRSNESEVRLKQSKARRSAAEIALKSVERKLDELRLAATQLQAVHE